MSRTDRIIMCVLIPVFIIQFNTGVQDDGLARTLITFGIAAVIAAGLMLAERHYRPR